MKATRIQRFENNSNETFNLIKICTFGAKKNIHKSIVKQNNLFQMNKAYLEKQVKKFSSDYQSELINRFEDQELKELFLKELEDAFRQGFNQGFNDGYKTGLQSGYQQGRMSRPRML